MRTIQPESRSEISAASLRGPVWLVCRPQYVTWRSRIAVRIELELVFALFAAEAVERASVHAARRSVLFVHLHSANRVFGHGSCSQLLDTMDHRGVSATPVFELRRKI